MLTEIKSFWDWQQHFSDVENCLQAIIEQRWPDVFFVPHCPYQTSITADTLFHNTKLPLINWFCSIYPKKTG